MGGLSAPTTQRHSPGPAVQTESVESTTIKQPLNHINFYYNNATSLVNKKHYLNLQIIELSYPEILCFTETWFTEDSAYDINNYQRFSTNRIAMKGGGVAIYVRSDITAYSISEKADSRILTSTEYEQTWCHLKIGKENILVGCIYRPPPLAKGFTSTTNDAINKSIIRATSLVNQHKYNSFTIVGDFNFPLINWNSLGGSCTTNYAPSCQFIETITSNCLKQPVLYPTYGNNQLDLIIVSDPTTIYNVNITAPLGCSEKNSLHSSLYWKLNISNSPGANALFARPNYVKGNYSGLNEFFLNIDWYQIFTGLTLNEKYNIIRHQYETACSKFIPNKIAVDPLKHKPKWLNKYVVMASKLKHKLFHQIRTCSANVKPDLQKKYNLSTRAVKKHTREAILTYERTIFDTSSKLTLSFYTHM